MKAILIDPDEHLLYKSGTSNHYSPPNDKVLYFCCADTNKFNLQHRVVNIFDGIKIQKLNRDSSRVRSISDKWRSLTYIDDNYLDVVKHILAGDTGYNTYNNIIIEDYFNDNTAEFCSKLPNIVFMNNISTNVYKILKLDKFGTKTITDLDICLNSAMMLSWVDIMKPKLSMTKLHTPLYIDTDIFETYCNTGIYKYYFDKVKHQIDFISDYKKREFRYITEDEILQAYATTDSNETRLIFKDIKIGLYDHVKRKENLFYYNQIRRQYGFHTSNPDSISGIDHCGDCALAQNIISKYLTKYSISDQTISINSMIALLRQSLNSGTLVSHGNFLSMYTDISLIYRVQGIILLNRFMHRLYSDMIPKPIDINIEKRYQIRNVLNMKDIISGLASKYHVENAIYADMITMKFVLLRFLSYKSMWYNQNTIYEYCYYDLTTKRNFDKTKALNCLNDLDEVYKKIQSGDYSNKSEIIIESYSKKIIVKYRNFSLDISKDWYYIDDLMKNKEVYLNAIMYDSRISTGYFINIPEIIYNILDMITYNNLYEISLGLHDMFFNKKSSVHMNIEHFTHVNCNIKTVADLINIPPKTVIIAYYHTASLLSEYINNTMPKDTVLIFITLDRTKTMPNLPGYNLQFPLVGFNFMKEPVKTDAMYIGLNFNGPPGVLYNIKNYYEQII
jgi:hypothetical protein